MEKIKSILMRATVAALLCVAFATASAVYVNGDTCFAICETYDTALEAAYGETYRDIHENRLAGSPLEAECLGGVDTATGRLILTRTDLSLEGTGGMDFELVRYYDSNEATLGRAAVENVPELEVDTVWLDYKAEDKTGRRLVASTSVLSGHKKALKNLLVKYTKGEGNRGVSLNGKKDIVKNTQRTKTIRKGDHDVYGLASGWRYDLPWIETVFLTEKKDWGERPVSLHCGSIGTMAIETGEDSASKSYPITGLAGYGYADIKLEDWDQTVDGIPCRYLLRDKAGLRTYFNADGVVVLQKDAHDNTITYTYAEDGIHLKKITDSVGREICFHYSGEEEETVLSSVTVQGQKTEGGVSEKTVTYETEQKSYTPLYGDQVSGPVLTAATVDGSRETYSYRAAEQLVSTAGEGAASQRVSTDQCFLLTKIKTEGSETCYEYRATVIRGEKKEGTEQKRDVATEQFYVTREYEKDTKTGKKSGGVKYDYFQRQGDTLLSYADFREGKNEVWQYGRSGLKTLTIVSSFNPNKYKTNGKYYDNKYKKSKINAATLRLKKDIKKNVTFYIYNENKMPEEQVAYGKKKSETIYHYDRGGAGSLVEEETSRAYGSRGNGAKTAKWGYTYDIYRNMLTERYPRAYLAKNRGKEALFTTTFTYNTGSGYPAGDTPYTLCALLTDETFRTAGTKTRYAGVLAENGIDYASILEQKSVDGGTYQTLSKTDYAYDSRGNETRGTVYPSYGSDGENESIRNEYAYNSLGQQTKTIVTLTSAKNPADNRTYTEEETVFDSFGNELSYTDENGLVTETSYDPETGEEKETVYAAGTEQESTDREYISKDTLKTMAVDEYGRVSIEIRDGLGNTVLRKDEAAGTWTESIYEYGDTAEDTEDPDTGEEEEDAEEDTEEETGEPEQTAHLIEEKTWTFEPEEKNFIINEDGERVPNFYMEGKGKALLSGKKYFYDSQGDQAGTAEFLNGEPDAAHCASWSFTKNETEVAGEDDSARTVTTSYSKELDPTAYQPEADPDNYYDQFNDAVLTETITETVTDAEGNTISEKNTRLRSGNRLETVTTYGYDDFGKTVRENTVTKKYQGGKWLPACETETLYTYDNDGNVTQTETKSRKEGETDWQSQITKTEYDSLGQVAKEYTPRGVEENVSTQYAYDILGRQIRAEIPQGKREDGSIVSQTVTTEYDAAGNVVAENGQIDGDRTARTEYTYDRQGNLTMVKNCLEGDKAQYVQYVYDIQGNKVRQFTGMTEPLAITVADAAGEDGSGKDIFTYAGKTYRITVSGKKKSDDIREAKYEYDGKDRLVSYTDPEGRKETYTYDESSNLTKTIDKNGNVHKNTYDYRNRLTEMASTPSQKGQEKKTGKETVHTYAYNAYGDVAIQDDIRFEYGDISGQVTKETAKLTKHKDIVKQYAYDSAGNRTAFSVSVGGNKELSLQYIYDGEGKLTSVTDEKGNRAVDYQYDADGNQSQRTVPGAGLSTTCSYDYQNNLTEMKNQTGTGVISEYHCRYQVNSQKSEETSNVLDTEGKERRKTAAYTYDLLGRITKETKTGEKDITYTYDNNNNRKETAQGNRITAYRYNKNDELLRTDTLNTDTEEDTVVLYKNDKNGNQLATVHRRDIPDGKKDAPYIDIDVTLGDNRLNDNVVNHYNALDQLEKTLTKNYKVSHTYDAEGLRTSKTVNGEKTVFVWDGDQLVMELSEGGKVKKRYIRGNSLVYSDRGEDTAKQYYVMNPHGDVVQLADKNGRVIKTYEYDSFGNEVKPDKKDSNPFRYCGEYYDKETEEIYLRARYYQPSVGRFLTRDTYTGEEDDPLSLHLYAYCNNDAVNMTDPSGHWGKQGNEYVHQTMTKEALMMLQYERLKGTAYTSTQMNVQLLVNQNELDLLLRGSILPDYIQAKKPWKYDAWFNFHFLYSNRGLYEKGKRSKVKILGFKLSNKNTFHGKNKKKLTSMAKKALNKISKKGPKNRRDSWLLIGCVLHSIQDYSAHSFVGDLESAKLILKNGGHLDSEAKNMYHGEWKPAVKKAKRKEIHRKTKDNPLKDFRGIHWVPTVARTANARYVKAVNDSMLYLKYIIREVY